MRETGTSRSHARDRTDACARCTPRDLGEAPYNNVGMMEIPSTRVSPYDISCPTCQAKAKNQVKVRVDAVSKFLVAWCLDLRHQGVVGKKPLTGGKLIGSKDKNESGPWVW